MYLNRVIPLRGLTLIEMLIGLCITILMTASLGQLSRLMFKNHWTWVSMMTLQADRMRLISELNQTLSYAGVIGCAVLSNDFPIINHTEFPYSRFNRINVYRDGAVKPGTDAISIREGGDVISTLLLKMPTRSDLTVDAQSSFKVGDIILIADCQTADIFQVKSISTEKNGQKSLQSEKSLSREYAAGSELTLLTMKTYYVGKTHQIDSSGQPIYALYIKINESKPIEWVTHIDQMQIRYDEWVGDDWVSRTGDEVVDWNQVIGVSITCDYHTSDLHQTIALYRHLHEIH